MLVLLSLFLTLVNLPSPIGMGAASVATKSGIIQGEIQGVVVAQRPFQKDEFDLAVIDGAAIRVIDERGILTTKIAWQSVVPIPGMKLPSMSRIAETLVGQQIPDEGVRPRRFNVIGELVGSGAASRIIPAIRVKVDGVERALPVDDLVSAGDSTKRQ
jgi:hypothetical protein